MSPRNPSLQAPSSANEISPRQAFAFLWYGRVWIAAFTALGILAGVLFAGLRGTIWEARSVLYVEQPGTLIGQSGRPAGERAALSFVNKEAEVLKSAPVLDAALQRGIRGNPVFGDTENELTWLKRNIDVRVGVEDDLISVSLDSPLIDEACTVVNAIVESYREQHAKLRRRSTSQVINKLSDEIARVEADWRKEQDSLLAFRRDNPGFGLDQEARAASAVRFQELNVALTKAELVAIEAEDALNIAGRLTESPDLVVELPILRPNSQDPAQGDPESLRRLRELRDERTALLRQVTPEHPAIAELDRKIAAVTDDWVQSLDQTYRTAQKRLVDLRKRVLDEEQKILSIDPKQAEYDAIEKRAARAREVADMLHQRLRELDINQGLDDSERAESTVTVYEVASRKSALVATSKTSVIAVLAFLGMILGVCTAWLLSLTDDRLRMKEEVERVLPILVSVPELEGDFASAIQAWNESSAFAEAMRSLRTSVYFDVRGSGSKTIQVTSAEDDDGKSLVTAGLGIAMARAGQRTLIIDADFRNPTQLRLFQVSAEDEAEGAALHVETSVDLLHVLPGDRLSRDPDEPLARPDLSAILKELFSDYDQILVDSPPLLEAANAKFIATTCDETLFVVRGGKTTATLLESARNSIVSVGGRIVGAVFNGVPGPSFLSRKREPSDLGVRPSVPQSRLG